MSTDEIGLALALSRALRAAVEAARATRAGGEPVTPRLLRDAAAGILQDAATVHLDYLEVLDPDTLQPPGPPLDADVDAHGADQRGEARQGHEDGTRTDKELLVAIAAFVGPARLIDNVVIGDEEDEARLLAATNAPDTD